MITYYNSISTLLISIIFLSFGCSLPKRMNAVPPNLQNNVIVEGIPNIRFYAGQDLSALIQEGFNAYKKEKIYLEETLKINEIPTAEFLAISGGGDKGAYGAGLLVGWTATGERPQFKVVTGISTGALIAPFAFLGPDYDLQLQNFYTKSSEQDILKKRNITSAIFNDALADNSPLYSLIKKSINKEMLNKIALEYQKGRLLFIATTDIDSRRSVIWNMGKIAESKHPNSLKLFQNILLASTAIPGVFPPTLIDVEVDGNKYQEMHVDGGAISQVFIYPPSFELDRISNELEISRKRNLYIIRNAKIEPNWSETKRRAISIAGRAISSLIQSQGMGDIFVIYFISKRDNVDFNLAFIPESFDSIPHENFNNEYMKELFNFGYELSLNGYPWEKYPPGYLGTENEKTFIYE